MSRAPAPAPAGWPGFIENANAQARPGCRNQKLGIEPKLRLCTPRLRTAVLSHVCLHSSEGICSQCAPSCGVDCFPELVTRVQSYHSAVAFCRDSPLSLGQDTVQLRACAAGWGVFRSCCWPLPEHLPHMNINSLSTQCYICNYPCFPMKKTEAQRHC